MTTGYRNKMRLLMQSAWNLARNGAKQFGGKSRDYIYMAMRLVWHDWRRTPETVYIPSLGSRYWLPGVERKVQVRRGQLLLPGIAL